MSFSSGSNDNKASEAQKQNILQQTQQNVNSNSSNYQQQQIPQNNLQQQQQQYTKNQYSQYNPNFASKIPQNHQTQVPLSQQQQLINQNYQQVQKHQYQQQYNQQMQYYQQQSVRSNQNQQNNPQSISINSSTSLNNQTVQIKNQNQQTNDQTTSTISKGNSTNNIQSPNIQFANHNYYPYKSMENFQRMQAPNIPQANNAGPNLNSTKSGELSSRQASNIQNKPANIPTMGINSGRSTDNYFPSTRLPPPNQNRQANIPGLNINVSRPNDAASSRQMQSNQNLQPNIPGLNANSGRSNDTISSQNIQSPSQIQPPSIPGLNLRSGKQNEGVAQQQRQYTNIPGLNPTIGKANEPLSPRLNQQSNTQPFNSSQNQSQAANNLPTDRFPSYQSQQQQNSGQTQIKNDQFPTYQQTPQNQQQTNQQNPIPKQAQNEQFPPHQQAIVTNQLQNNQQAPNSRQSSINQFPIFQQTQKQTQINPPAPTLKRGSIDQSSNFQPNQTQPPNQPQINQQVPNSRQSSFDQFPTIPQTQKQLQINPQSPTYQPNQQQINQQIPTPKQTQNTQFPTYKPSQPQMSQQIPTSNQTQNTQFPAYKPNQSQINQQIPTPKQTQNDQFPTYQQTQSPNQQIPPYQINQQQIQASTQKQSPMKPPLPVSKRGSVDQFPTFQQNQQQINQQIPTPKQTQNDQFPSFQPNQQQINQQITTPKQTQNDQFPSFQQNQQQINQQIPTPKQTQNDQFPTYQQTQSQNQQQINQQIPSYQQNQPQTPVQKQPLTKPPLPVSKRGSVDQFPTFQQNQQQNPPKQTQNDQFPSFQQTQTQNQQQINQQIPNSTQIQNDQFPSYQQNQPQIPVQKQPLTKPPLPVSKRGSVDQFPTFQQNQQQINQQNPPKQTQNDQFPTFQQTQTQNQQQINQQIPNSTQTQNDQFPSYQQSQPQTPVQKQPLTKPPLPVSKRGSVDQFPTFQQNQQQNPPKQTQNDQFPTFQQTQAQNQQQINQQIPNSTQTQNDQFPTYQKALTPTPSNQRIPLSKRASFDLTNFRDTSINKQSLDNFPSYQQLPLPSNPTPNQTTMKLPPHPRPRFISSSSSLPRNLTQETSAPDSPFPTFNPTQQNVSQQNISLQNGSQQTVSQQILQKPRVSVLPHPQNLNGNRSTNTSSIHLQNPKFSPIEQKPIRGRASMFVQAPTKIEDEQFNSAIEDKSTWLNLEFSENVGLVSLHERALPLVGGISFSNVKHADRVTSNSIINRHTILEMIYQHLESIGFYQTAEILSDESGHNFQSNLPLTDDDEYEDDYEKEEENIHNSFDYERSDLRLLVSLAVGYRENAWEISPEQQQEQHYIIEKFEANVFSGPYREDVKKIWEEFFDASKNVVLKDHYQKLMVEFDDYKNKTNSASFNHLLFLDSFFKQSNSGAQNDSRSISSIKLASLRRLVLMMTLSNDVVLTVGEQRQLFLAIQSLTSSRHFLSHLTYFYECDVSQAPPNVVESLQKNQDLLSNPKKRKIQTSVLSLIKNWVLFHGLSIGADTLNDIMAFCRRVIDNSPFEQTKKIAQFIFDTVPTLTNGISNEIKSQKLRNKSLNIQDFPQPKIDLTNESQGLIVFSPHLTILDPKPTEVARQICLIFHKKFATIHTIEFLDGFKNQKTTQRSPTLEEFFVMDNHLTEVVSKTFIEADDKSDAFIRLFKIAKKLRKLLNFNSLATFCRILLREDVRLLALPPDSVIKELQAMQIDSGDLDQIQSQNQNAFKTSPTKYDTLLADSTKKGLPSIPNLYAELKKLEMRTKPDLILGLIDIEKIMELGSRCSTLYYAQNSNYCFVPIPQIQKVIINKDLSFSIEQFESSITNLMEARLNSVLL